MASRLVQSSATVLLYVPGAKVRNTLTACETELQNFTIYGSANIKIIATPWTPIIIKLLCLHISA